MIGKHDLHLRDDVFTACREYNDIASGGFFQQFIELVDNRINQHRYQAEREDSNHQCQQGSCTTSFGGNHGPQCDFQIEEAISLK